MRLVPFSMVNVLMISRDRNMFDSSSDVRERIKLYFGSVQQIHIIVFAKSSLGLSPQKIADNAWLYPTNSLTRWTYIIGAAKIGRNIIRNSFPSQRESLITAQDPFDCGLAAIILGKLCKLPIEIQLHTDPFSTYFSGILNFVRKELVKFTLPRSQGLLAVSEKLADEVSSQFNYNRSNIMVLPVYIDAEKLLSKQSGAIKVQGQSKTIIVVARLSPEKNVALAIKILAEVRKSTDARLVVVGSGPEADKLKNLAEQLQVSDFVSFEGWRNDVTPYYKGADVFLQTSYFEGYGMALVEAGLNHLPVISTPVGLAGELINGKEIIICPQDDEKQFARSVLSILANPSLSRVLADNLFDRLDRDIKSKQEYMSLIKSHWEKIVSNT